MIVLFRKMKEGRERKRERKREADRRDSSQAGIRRGGREDLGREIWRKKEERGKNKSKQFSGQSTQCRE